MSLASTFIVDLSSKKPGLHQRSQKEGILLSHMVTSAIDVETIRWSRQGCVSPPQLFEIAVWHILNFCPRDPSTLDVFSAAPIARKLMVPSFLLLRKPHSHAKSSATRSKISNVQNVTRRVTRFPNYPSERGEPGRPATKTATPSSLYRDGDDIRW